MTNHCPFCGNYAYAASVGDAYRMDCRYCEIQVEITKRAYAARCPNPVAVLDYIREKMKTSTRPRVDIADMKRTTPIPAAAETTEPTGDLLTAAAKAIGTTLGKIAVTTGIAKPAADSGEILMESNPPKKASPTRKPAVKKAAAKRPASVKKKAAAKKPIPRSAAKRSKRQPKPGKV